VNAVDAVAIRLGDPAARDGVFDEAALAAVVAAGYDAAALEAEGPYSAVFDELRLGLAAPSTATANAVWGLTGSSDRTEASFTIQLPGGDGPRIDALWRGAVVARVVHDRSTITEVAVTRPALGTIDADIESDLGALPTDPAALESERRARLIERLRERLDQPDALDDDRLDEILRDAGAADVGELLAGTANPAAVTVAFSPSPPPAPQVLVLPVTAALLVRDVGASIAGLLADSRAAADALEPLALQRANPDRLPRRRPIVVVWLLPQATFDDSDWPGAEADMTPDQARAARRAAAAAWLAEQGIALAAFTP
jgi:hypothetical protein